MLTEELYHSLTLDLEQSIIFEQKGDLNKSRVIARQVAGKAIRILYNQLRLDNPRGKSPYQYLLDIENHKEIFLPIHDEIRALTTRVNTDFSFSGEMNLIEAAKNILLFVKEFNSKHG